MIVQETTASSSPIYRKFILALVMLLVFCSVAMEILLMNHFHKHITDQVDNGMEVIDQSLQALLKQQVSELKLTPQPIDKADALGNYGEFFKETEEILGVLGASLKSDLALFIHKKYITQSTWEEERVKLGKKAPLDWDKLSHSVLTYTSTPFLPQEFLSIVEKHNYSQYYEVSWNNKEWIVYVKPLFDVSQQSVGDLLVMHDVSLEKASFKKLVLESSLLGLVLLALVLGFVHYLLRHIKSSFLAQQEALSRIAKIASRIPGMIYQYRLHLDGSSCLPFASDAIEHIYKLTAKEVMEDATKIFRIIHPEDIEGVISSFQKSAQELTPWKLEYRIKFNDGTVRWLYGNAIPEREKDGSTLWHGFIDDITEQKTLEYELKEMNEQLYSLVEKEVAQRIKIQEEQEIDRQFLIQKSKLSSMGEMMGAIAHQWRQPLNALNMNIQNLDDDFDEGLVDKAFIDAFIAKNRQTILFMSKTIDDFRNFFKIDKEKKEFLALDAINETLSLQSAQFKNYNIHIEIKGENQKLYGFRGEFQQVILNILNNAKDAIWEKRRKEGRIDIVLEPKSITIEDNGGGIKEEIMERIFEPYFTTKSQGEGTGIGLYMSKIIIEKNMGWKLEACNTRKGIKFTISY